ncbi:MAG: HAD family hydrolase [Rhizomicrobium sp.]|jgi:histidinol-phosphate phosphatase family protein
MGTERRDRPIVFLDRDGTIVVDRHYLSDPARLELLAGAAEGLRRLSAVGYRLAIATNQSGVGRGYFSESVAEVVNARLVAMLAAESVTIDAVACCYHSPDEDCDCRKPARGLADRIVHAIGGSLEGAVVIGDKVSDMSFAKAIGGRGVLLAPEPVNAPDCGQLAAARDLIEAADIVNTWRQTPAVP